MAIILNDNVQVNLGKPIDNKYLQPLLNRPYTGETEVNSTIISGLRYTGLTVNVNGEEYWYKNGIADIDLILKTSSGLTSTISGGTNIGGGEEVFAGLNGEALEFRTIIGSGGTIVETSGNTIIIKGGGTGSTNSNNVYILTGSSTYNITNDDFFIGVSGVTSPILYLSGVTTPGKEIEVSDIGGNAFLNPITINASPNLVDGDNIALIETDFGSIRFLWSGFSWKILGFVN